MAGRHADRVSLRRRVGIWLPRPFGRWGRREAPGGLALVVASVVLLVGVAVSVATAGEAHDLRTGLTVQGTVTEVREDDDTIEVSVVFFVDGAAYECSTNHVDATPERDTVLPVRYVRDDPTTCALGGTGESYAGAWASGAVSALALVYLGTAVVRRRGERREVDAEELVYDGW